MSVPPLITIKIIFRSLAALAFTLAAWFELRDRAQSVRVRQRTRVFYNEMWEQIKDIGILDLPELVIRWVLQVLNKFMKYLHSLMQQMPMWVVIISATLMMIYMTSMPGWKDEFPAPIDMLFLSCTAVQLLILLVKNLESQKTGNDIFSKIFRVYEISVSYGWAVICIIILDNLLKLSLEIAFVSVIVTLPAISKLLEFLLTVMFSNIKIKNMTASIRIFCSSMAISFVITMISLFIGHLAEPHSWVPKTVQILYSNVFFDGLTMIVTIKILNTAIRDHSWLNIPIAIILDVIAAGILAFLSLYIGLMFTEHSVSMLQVWRTLWGRTLDGVFYSFGPYFWVMHTTFIPTLIYLSVIMLCWIGKLVVLPVVKLFEKGGEVRNPHHLTAGVFAFVAAVFLGISTLFGHIHEAKTNVISPPAVEQTK